MKKITLLLLGFALLANFTIKAQHPDFYYSSPVDGAEFVNPEQVILLKSKQLIAGFDESLISLQNESGNHEFEIETAEGNNLFLRPITPLERNSDYHLVFSEGALTYSGSVSKAFNLRFSTEKSDNITLLKEYYQREDHIELNQANQIKNAPSRYTPPENDNNYPARYPNPVVENLNDPYPGYLFINMGARSAPDYDSYSAILDNNAVPIWFVKKNARDLKILADQTFTHDYRNNANLALQSYVIFDNQFQVIDSIKMGNGYFVDTHDMLLMDNDHYLMMAYDPQIVDMSAIVEGGNPEAIVTGFVVQEVDKDRNVYFQWRSWDHVEITDVSDTVDLMAEEIDYVHGNAFEFDLEGNLMMSLRNMEEITKINFETGEIIWRLGLHAKQNEFDFDDTIGWSWQHDIRQLPNGNITVYDNGRNHFPEQFSQAVEYQIDEENKTASLVWNHREDPDIYRPATGSHRRITEDRSLIGWGMGWPLLASEVSTDGTRHLDLIGPTGVNDYRVLRFNWMHNVFTFSKDTLDYGVYDDYIPVNRAFTITNQMDTPIRITSSHNHISYFAMVTQLPIDIEAGGTASVIVSFQPQESGEYNDVLTLNYDNADTTERIARQIHLTGKTPTGIKEYENDKVSVYPNPVADAVNISIDLPGEKTIRIVNLQGQEVAVLITDESSVRLSTSHFAKGVYMGLVKTDDKTASFRFVKK